jgi:hypothetical protein
MRRERTIAHLRRKLRRLAGNNIADHFRKSRWRLREYYRNQIAIRCAHPRPRAYYDVEVLP